MKSISVDELRRDPAPVIADLERGVAYELTRDNHVIGTINPVASSAALVPRKVNGPARTRMIARHEVRPSVQ